MLVALRVEPEYSVFLSFFYLTLALSVFSCRCPSGAGSTEGHMQWCPLRSSQPPLPPAASPSNLLKHNDLSCAEGEARDKLPT